MAKTSKPAAPSAPQPPYLKRVHLRNVPPLRDVKADFKPGLNIIIGKNGSGKTNFMRLVSELAELYSEKYRGVGCELKIFYEKDFDVSFHEQSKELTSKKSIIRLAKQMPLMAVVVSEGSVVEDSILGNIISIGDDYDIITVWHGIPSYNLPVIDESAEFTLSDTGMLSFVTPTVNAWEVESQLVQGFLSSIRMMYYSELESLPQQEKPKIIGEWIKRSVNVHLDRLNHYLATYSPLQAVRLGSQFQVYSISSSDEIVVKGLALEYQIGDDWLPFNALSDGTKRLFYIISELLTGFAYPSGEEGDLVISDNDKIIFLEEPELGIHPDQLQLLLQLIREVSKEHQVIMTTHSPQTLDMLSAQELDRITICEFIPGKGTQMRKLSAAKKNKAKAYLRDSGFLSEFWRFSNLEDPD